MERVYNFAAGPATMPEEALRTAANEMLNYGGSGMSVMEMSHRGKAYQAIFDETVGLIRELLQVPDNYKVLLLQGGATGQFAAVPLNLMNGSGSADYIDSGNFAHQDVTQNTFTIAAELRAAGADFPAISYAMFSRQTKNRALLYVRVLNSMRFSLDDRLVFLTVTQNDFRETDTDKSQTEGFVDFPLSIDGVEVSIALMEVKQGQYKASLRSKRISVNAVASEFGGGGHILASGCMLFGEYEEVIERLTYAVYKQL